MPKPAEKHTHKLKRLVHKSGNVVFFCVLDCSYKISSALALGKSCICWRCGEKFLMNEYSLRLAKPHCENCHKPKSFKNDSEKVLNSSSLTESVTLSLQERLNQVLQSRKELITDEEI